MLVLDVGGTYVKYALTDAAGCLLPDTVGQTPSDAQGSYEAFLAVLSRIIASAQERQDVGCACVSIPGPFDFEAGVSRMRHKFPALYGQSLRVPFERAGIGVSFLHDSTAFMLGEARDGVAQDMASPCCVMLGTGLGFAFMRGGRVCVNAQRGPAFSLWNMPYEGGIAEDYVSTRAIQGAYGEALPVKTIADRARQGDARAAQAFAGAGFHLSALLGALIPRLGCDGFVLGGQIAKSADLFGLQLDVPWRVSQHLDDAALRGASAYAAQGRAACELTLDPTDCKG